ncbi:uncharacterized protein [Typha angustifolia]|uniref:uncharacterized protein n=1 Tax=Typha angustifolia TaxID=59011 RepID=UPI003C2C1BD8
MDFLGGGGGGGGRGEAERCLDIAAKLLYARDLVGSKRFAERALESDPLLAGVDEILAVSDVLLAAQNRLNNHVDYYSVLQLTGGSATADPVTVKRQYRHLSLLLNPNRNHYPGCDVALKLVADAYAVLSDPSKKSLFDAEIEMAKPSPPPTGGESGDDFWTACPTCCHVHQYARTYQNRSLRCPNCSRPFNATEIAEPPPVVPGTNMYYCAWGFFPLGFPNGSDLSNGWKPFYPMFPTDTKQEGPQHDGGNKPPATRNKKTMARKSVGGGLKKRSFGGESESWTGVGARVSDGEFRGININEEAKGWDGGGQMGGGGGGEEEMVSFHIDVDATDELLGNLHNLPFLREEEIPGRMP